MGWCVEVERGGGRGLEPLCVGLSWSPDVEELCLAGSCPAALVLPSWELPPGFLLLVLPLPPSPLKLLLGLVLLPMLPLPPALLELLLDPVLLLELSFPLLLHSFPRSSCSWCFPCSLFFTNSFLSLFCSWCFPCPLLLSKSFLISSCSW